MQWKVKERQGRTSAHDGVDPRPRQTARKSTVSKTGHQNSRVRQCLMSYQPSRVAIHGVTTVASTCTGPADHPITTVCCPRLLTHEQQTGNHAIGSVNTTPSLSKRPACVRVACVCARGVLVRASPPASHMESPNEYEPAHCGRLGARTCAPCPPSCISLVCTGRSGLPGFGSQFRRITMCPGISGPCNDNRTGWASACCNPAARRWQAADRERNAVGNAVGFSMLALEWWLRRQVHHLGVETHTASREAQCDAIVNVYSTRVESGYKPGRTQRWSGRWP